MRVLAIGDIHGCSRALDTLLAAVKPQSDDRIVTLGDYVDRGPDSYGVLDRLIALHATGRLIALRGNHDQMMVNARDSESPRQDWLDEGGRETLASYSILGDAGKLVDVPERHWEFLEKVCVNWYEIDTHFFVHANAYPDLPLDEQPEYMVLRETFDNPAPHISGKIMVCGHTSQKSGKPLNLGHAICIDTRACGRGWLTCLDVVSGRIWQANQRGESRVAWIDDIT
jgi:serine/threonine protein phosphatase 1